MASKCMTILNGITYKKYSRYILSQIIRFSHKAKAILFMQSDLKFVKVNIDLKKQTQQEIVEHV